MPAEPLNTKATIGSLRVGDWLVDPAVDQLSRQGEVIKLEPRTMRLLVRLAESAGQVVSSQQLLDDVWTGVVVGPASVYQAVSQLRKLLGDTDPAPTYVATVPRKGYRLVAPVQRNESRMRRQTDSVAPVTSSIVTPDVPALRPSGLPRSQRWRLAAAGLLVAIVAISIVVLRSHWLPDAGATTVVVLPFIDMTADKSDQAFCDGLTEELSSALAQLPSLRIVARTSAFSFRDQNIDIREIGRKLSATHALEGSVRRSGTAVRVMAQLVDLRHGHRSWSETYDLPVSDFLRLQSDIAKSVAAELEIRFPQQSVKRIAARGSASPEAYELYLLGRHYYRQRTSQANARSIEINARAIALDRNFALAYVGLAQAHLNEYALDGRPIHELTGEIEPLIQAALRLDPDLSEAYAVRGALRRDQNLLKSARQDLRRAIQLNPSNVQAVFNLGRVYEYEGLPVPALDSFNEAVQLDPLDFMRHVDRCFALQDLGRYSDAAADCAVARRLQPESEWGLTATSWLSRAQGRLADALRWNERAIRIAPANPDLHMQRVDLLLDVGLIQEAYAAVQRVLEVSADDPGLKIMYADVVMADRGPAATRKFLAQLDLGDSVTATELLIATQLSLAAQDYPRAQALAARATASPDFSSVELAHRSLIKWGISYQLPLALLELHNGDRSSAIDRANALLRVLSELERSGYVNWGIHSVRADALGLLGDADGAMRALHRAVDSGWRSARLARRDPYLAQLVGRDDFMELMRRVDRLNASELSLYQAGNGALIGD